MSFPVRFQRELPAGVCVAVSLPEGDGFAMPPALHPDEAAFVFASPAPRRASFIGGRVALRTAMTALGADAGQLGDASPALPILSTPRGAPALPSGYVGSVSHKRELAVAIVARARADAAHDARHRRRDPASAADGHRDPRPDATTNARRWRDWIPPRATRRCCFGSRRRRRSTRRWIRGCSAWSRFRRWRSSTAPGGGRHARLALARRRRAVSRRAARCK